MFLLGPPPFFWSGLPQETAPAVIQEESPSQSQQEFKGGLTVSYDSFLIDDESGLAVMKGNVRAIYDATTLVCDELRVNQETQEFQAVGKVEVFDPDGYLKAEELWGTWIKPPEGATQEELDAFVLGRASNAQGHVGNARFKAAQIVVHPGLWEMTDVHGTISSKDNAPYGLFARRVTLRPGKSGTAERLYLEILGRRIGPLPKYTFTLDQRVATATLPTIRHDSETGFGVGWTVNRKLSDRSAVYAGYESFPGIAPKYNLEFAYTPLKPDSSTAKIVTRSDLAERAADGWFDNITTVDRWAEQGDLRNEKITYSIGTRWNEGTGARLDDGGEISKLIDIVYERGGEVGPYGTLFQGRLQQIRPSGDESFLLRAMFQGTVLAPDVPLGQSLYFRSRADAFLTQSTNGTYSWLRGSAGLIFEPRPGLTLGAAYVASVDFGEPDFIFDPLYSKQAAHFRIDWTSGPYSVKYLYKFDIDRGQWYDREWEVALVADAFQPFIQYRQYPSNYQIGVRFRIDNFIDKITSRDPGRNRKKAD